MHHIFSIGQTCFVYLVPVAFSDQCSTFSLPPSWKNSSPWQGYLPNYYIYLYPHTACTWVEQVTEPEAAWRQAGPIVKEASLE